MLNFGSAIYLQSGVGFSWALNFLSFSLNEDSTKLS